MQTISRVGLFLPLSCCQRKKQESRRTWGEADTGCACSLSFILRRKPGCSYHKPGAGDFLWFLECHLLFFVHFVLLFAFVFLFIFLLKYSWLCRRLRICLQCWRPRFNPWVRKIPWRRAWQSTPAWTEEPGGLQSRGLHRVGNGWATRTFTFIVDLQCCVHVCCTVKWFSYAHICMHSFLSVLFHYGFS